MKTEDWLNRKIDKVRAQLEVVRVPSPEITDQDEIEKMVTHARKIFTAFLHARNSKILPSKIGFTMTFDSMASTLGLSYVTPDILKNKMDEIVLSVPGMAKTQTGYTVSDPDLIYENFGPKSSAIKIFKLLSANPDKWYSYKEIADELSLNKITIYRVIPGFLSEDKVVVNKEGKVRLS